jgi:hypothetical protein
MNSFLLNGSAINGSGFVAAVVFLPSATASVELALNERIAVSMSGEIGISLTTSGDISRVSNLGSAPAAITFLAAGDLTLNRQIYLGEAFTGFDVSASGTLAKVNLGPSGTSEWGMSLSGNVDRNVYLSGEATHQFDLVGSLSAGRSLGEASAAFSLDAVGGMYLIGGLSGTADIALIPTGNLNQGFRTPLPTGSITWGRGFTGSINKTQMMTGTVTSHTDLVGRLSLIAFLTGSTQVDLGLAGSLSNNSGGYDLVKLTMVRPYINRDMTR